MDGAPFLIKFVQIHLLEHIYTFLGFNKNYRPLNSSSGLIGAPFQSIYFKIGGSGI